MTRAMLTHRDDVPVATAAAILAELERVCEIQSNAAVVEVRIQRDRDGEPVLATFLSYEFFTAHPGEESDATWEERAAVTPDQPVPLLPIDRVPVHAPGSLRARLAAEHRN